jgi:hypothetical protein
MNKIQKAISDCKLQLDKKKKEKLILYSQIDILEQMLYFLEGIEVNEDFPHILKTQEGGEQ